MHWQASETIGRRGDLASNSDGPEWNIHGMDVHLSGARPTAEMHMVTNRLAELEAAAAQAARAEAAQTRQDAAQAMAAQDAGNAGCHDSGGKAPIVAKGRRERHHKGLEQVWSWTHDGPEGFAKLPHFHGEEAEIALRS